MADSPQHPKPKSPVKHGRSRRDLLKTLAAGAGAAAGAAALPAKWVKPMVDTVVVPLRAQGSITSDLTGEVTVLSQTFSCGNNISMNLLVGDGGTDIQDPTVTLNPPVGGVTVHMEITKIGGDNNDATFSGTDFSQDAITNDSGIATFGDAIYLPNTDGSSGDAAQGILVTFDAPGSTECQVEIVFPVPL